MAPRPLVASGPEAAQSLGITSHFHRSRGSHEQIRVPPPACGYVQAVTLFKKQGFPATGGDHGQGWPSVGGVEGEGGVVAEVAGGKDGGNREGGGRASPGVEVEASDRVSPDTVGRLLAHDIATRSAARIMAMGGPGRICCEGRPGLRLGQSTEPRPPWRSQPRPPGTSSRGSLGPRRVNRVRLGGMTTPSDDRVRKIAAKLAAQPQLPVNDLPATLEIYRRYLAAGAPNRKSRARTLARLLDDPLPFLRAVAALEREYSGRSKLPRGRAFAAIH
jgi:hypothetical protein